MKKATLPFIIALLMSCNNNQSSQYKIEPMVQNSSGLPIKQKNERKNQTVILDTIKKINIDEFWYI